MLDGERLRSPLKNYIVHKTSDLDFVKMAKGVGSGNHSSPRAKTAKLSEQALGSVKTASLLGLSSEDCAALILAAGLAPKECPKFTGRTLRRMIERDADVRQAADMGRATGRYRVAQAIFDMATQQDNLSAAIYWEKTRNPSMVASSESILQFAKAQTESLSSADSSAEGVNTEVFVYLPDNARDEDRATHQLTSSVEPGAVDVFYEHQEGDLVQNPDLALKRLPQAE